MTLPTALALSLVLTQQILTNGEHPENTLKRSLHSLMPDGTSQARKAHQPNQYLQTGGNLQNPESEHERYLERARKRKDLTEWEHLSLSSYDGSATLRSVKSTVPKGLYFAEENIMSEAEDRRIEERRKLRSSVGLDREIEGGFVML